MAMTMRQLLAQSPVIPVARFEDAAVAVAVARALAAGGLDLLLVEGPASETAVAAIAAALPGFEVGAGGLLSNKEIKRAVRAGARFVATPGFLPKLSEQEVPLLASVATASEIMRALEADITILGLFPAPALEVLEAFETVFPRTLFCPMGPLDAAAAATLLTRPNVAAVAAPFVVPAHVVAAENWDQIALLAMEARQMRRGTAWPP